MGVCSVRAARTRAIARVEQNVIPIMGAARMRVMTGTSGTRVTTGSEDPGMDTRAR